MDDICKAGDPNLYQLKGSSTGTTKVENQCRKYENISLVHSREKSCRTNVILLQKVTGGTLTVIYYICTL